MVLRTLVVQIYPCLPTMAEAHIHVGILSRTLPRLYAQHTCGKNAEVLPDVACRPRLSPRNSQMGYERWGWNIACASAPRPGPSHPSICPSLVYERAVQGYGDGLSDARISLYWDFGPALRPYLEIHHTFRAPRLRHLVLTKCPLLVTSQSLDLRGPHNTFPYVPSFPVPPPSI